MEQLPDRVRLALETKVVWKLVQAVSLVLMVAGFVLVQSFFVDSFVPGCGLFPDLAQVPLTPRLTLVLAGLSLLLLNQPVPGRFSRSLCRLLSVMTLGLAFLYTDKTDLLLSFSVMLVGLSLVLLSSCRKEAVIAAQIAVMVLGIITTSAIIAYGFGLTLSFPSLSVKQMPVFCALAFGAAGFALFFVRSEIGPPSVFFARDAGGLLARRILLPLWLALPFLGLVTGLRTRYQEASTIGIIALNAVIPCILLLVAHVLHRKEVERQAAYDEILSLNQALNRQFLELMQTTEETKKAVRARSEFLANMNHELRTPLAGVQGGLDLALSGPLAPEQRELLQLSYKSSSALLRLIENILDFAAMQEKKVVIVKNEFELRPLIASIIGALEENARCRGLTSSIGADVPLTVAGDTERLKQVLTNLLDNAIKYTDRGGVSLQVVKADKNDPSSLKFAVIDTGIGIAPEMLERVFEPFVQVDGSSTRKYGGIGLGLSIVQSLVKLMGGETGIESTLFLGSTFWFTLPMAVSSGMTFQQVISAHAQWKATFVKAITSRTPLDAVGMFRDDLCNVGLWLHGEAKSKYAHLNSFNVLVHEHAQFHAEAAKICGKANAGRYEEALHMLDASTPYMEASEAFIQAFTAFRKEAQAYFSDPFPLEIAKIQRD